MNFNTKTIHGNQRSDPGTGAVMTPIYQTSTFEQKSLEHHGEFSYARTSNPTRTALENALASIENGKFALAFGSGMAAIDAVIRLLKPGEEVIANTNLYGGTYRLFEQIWKSFGIKFHYANFTDVTELCNLINPNTKLLWLETPTNPLLQIIDISKMVEVAKKNHLILAVDNTFATPYLQRPLDLGADIVVHSATKYLGGHSDVVLGAIITSDAEISKKLFFIQNTCGAIAGPMDSFLVLRGIKTLHVRMQRHSENTRKIAEFLQNNKNIEKVYWPGFKDFDGHEIAVNQMSDFGGILSFKLKGNLKNINIFLKNLKLFKLAESLGGVESLVGHPATMTHASLNEKQRNLLGITENLLRLSVGIEDCDDLIEDLDQSIRAID
ncbi:MAG: PLP-dependent aspartate aminotransferase family protein [Lutimonas sp.]